MRRALQSAVAGGLLASSMLVSALPAHASVLPSGTLAIAAAGSDTTQSFMNDYLLGTSSLPPKTTSTYNGTTFNVQTYNIPAVPPAAGYTVDEDARCPANGSGGLAGATNYTGTIVWTPAGATNDGNPPHAPFGSGAGRSALIAEEHVGTNSTQLACIDIGRSSSFSSNASFEYYGFALDAVSWATTSLKAPQMLTRQQVKDIFLCNVRNWSQVGGVPGPIQRYLPQASSGTYQTFLTEFLDLPSNGSVPTNQADDQNGSCPDPVQLQDKNGNPFEENQAQTVKNADIDKMIMPYSAGVWAFQKNNSSNPTLDRRNGIRIGSLATNLAKASDADTAALNSSYPVIRQNAERWNGTNVKYELDYVNSPNPNGVVSDQNTALANGSGATPFSKTFGFSGIRFLFNIVDVNNAQSYGPALGLVGFDNTTTGNPTTVSPLCDGSSRTLILSFGFAPLPQTTSTFNKSTTAPTACREFT